VALISVVVAPSGKPMTVHTGTLVPRKFLAARFTHVGLMQTEANPNCSASEQSTSMSSAVASAARRV